MRDVICKIKCGDCCVEYWYEVFDLPAHPGYACPLLTENGCKLPRSERPIDCIAYLCSKSEMYGCIEVAPKGTKIDSKGRL